MTDCHHNSELKRTGLHVNEQLPQLRASPDALICDFNEHLISEGKCLHKYKDSFKKDKTFPLELNQGMKKGPASLLNQVSL